jgi:hypothetical protein
MENKITIKISKFIELNQNLKKMIYTYLIPINLVKVYYLNKKIQTSVNKANKNINRNAIKVFFYLRKMRDLHINTKNILNLIEDEIDLFFIAFKKFKKNLVPANDIISGFVLFVEHYLSISKIVVLRAYLIPLTYLESKYLLELIKQLDKEKVYYYLDSMIFYNLERDNLKLKTLKCLSYMKYIYLPSREENRTHCPDEKIYEILLKNKIQIFLLRDEEIPIFKYETSEPSIKSEYFQNYPNNTETFVFYDSKNDQYDHLKILKNNSKSIKNFYVNENNNFNENWMKKFDENFPEGLSQLNKIYFNDSFPPHFNSILFNNIDTIGLGFFDFKMKEVKRQEKVKKLFKSIFQTKELFLNIKCLQIRLKTYDLEDLFFKNFKKFPNLQTICYSEEIEIYPVIDYIFINEFFKFKLYEYSIKKVFPLLSIILKNNNIDNNSDVDLCVKVGGMKFLDELFKFLNGQKMAGVIKKIKAIHFGTFEHLKTNHLQYKFNTFSLEHLKNFYVECSGELINLNEVKNVDSVTLEYFDEKVDCFKYLKGKNIKILNIIRDYKYTSLKYIASNLSEFKTLKVLRIGPNLPYPNDKSLVKNLRKKIRPLKLEYFNLEYAYFY